MKFPKDILVALDKKYWQNKKQFKIFLKGEMEFPLQIALKMPTTSSQIRNNIGLIQEFVQAWQCFESEFPLCKIQYQSKNFQQFGMLNLPQYLIFENRNVLISIFSQEQQLQLQNLQQRINQIINLLNQHFNVNIKQLLDFLIDNLESFHEFSADEMAQLLQVLPQLKCGMGEGLYLRNLPIVGVDSKFIEQHFKVIEIILNHLYHNEILECGGLIAWLNCQEKPSDWLLIKPLCKNSQLKLANLPLFRLNSQILLHYELPADYILVIENEQSCLSLPYLQNTIAVAGGGKNIVWLKAEWLKHKKVYYWGDIDSDGLFILSLARKYCPHVVALMMDKNTILRHQHFMVNDTGMINEIPSFLNYDEKMLFISLKNGEFMNNRLEQERLNVEFVHQQLTLYFDINMS